MKKWRKVALILILTSLATVGIFVIVAVLVDPAAQPTPEEDSQVGTGLYYLNEDGGLKFVCVAHESERDGDKVRFTVTADCLIRSGADSSDDPDWDWLANRTWLYTAWRGGAVLWIM